LGNLESSNKILIIGGTGYIGRHIYKASLTLGHPTFLLVREATTSNPEKAKVLESFQASGAIILHDLVFLGYAQMHCSFRRSASGFS